MVFKNITTKISDPFNDTFYHCDFVELISLARGELAVDKDYLEGLYPTKKSSDFVSLFSIFESRKQMYQSIYPFEIDYDNQLIKLKRILTDKNKLYIFFILCSRNEKVIYEGNILESDFEHISTLALKKYLPSEAKVFHFGKSSYQQDRYNGTLVSKLDKLAADIKCETAYDPNDFSEFDTGDGGLDVVGWIPFPCDSDNFMHIPVFLGQCAIGKNWQSKHYDVEKMKNNIHFPPGTASMMYVSHDLRKDNGKFKKTSSRAHILFDRFRLISLVNNDNQLMETIKKLATFTKIIPNITSENIDILEV